MTPRGRQGWRGLAWLALLAGWLLAAPAAFATPTFPALTGRVVDQANVLSPEAEAAITAQSEQLEQQTGHQFVVVTLSSLQGYPIEDYGYQLLRHWGIGRRGQNDGVILLVAPSERKVRIEVGYGLEPVITDALSSLILQRSVLPQFRAGTVEAGITAGATAVVQQLSAGEVAAKAATDQAAARPPERGSPIVGIIILVVIFLVMRALMGGGRRRGGGWLGPLIIGSAIGRGARGWTGGGGDWGGGGGGFSGGGGSAGGGGASGSW